MTDDQRIRCEKIINSAAASAAARGGALAQLPGADLAVIKPLHISMTVSLGQVLGLSITEKEARELLAKVDQTTTPRILSHIFVGWVPIIGNAISASVAFACTVSIGRAVVARLDEGSKGVETNKGTETN